MFVGRDVIGFQTSFFFNSPVNWIFHFQVRRFLGVLLSYPLFFPSDFEILGLGLGFLVGFQDTQILICFNQNSSSFLMKLSYWVDFCCCISVEL